MHICFSKPSFFKNILFAILFFQGLALFAQTKAPAADEEHPKKIALPKDRIVVDLSYDAWLNSPQGIKQKPRSPGVNVYLMWDYPVGYGPVSIAIGGGLSSYNVHSNGQVVYSIDGKYTSLIPLTTPYKINKLSVNYFEIPLELRIRTRGANSFKVYVGGKAGYAFNIHTKISDDDGKRKIYNIKNIDPLRYGVTFRVGYNKFDLQAFYSLSELFQKGKGDPNMIPVSVGIGFLFY